MPGLSGGVPFGAQLQQWRERARLSQEHLGELARVGTNTISELERGVTHPRRETAARLADALGLTGSDRAEFEAAARDRPVREREARDGAARAAAAIRMLPRGLESFTGRRAELDWLTGAVQEAVRARKAVGVFCVTGMAGVGKTALALQAAHRMADQFPGGQLFVDLRGFTRDLGPVSSVQALGTLLRSLGVADPAIPEDAQERAALYRHRLAGASTLIVLDNAHSTAQVRPLLPGTAGCVVIVTSRQNLSGLDDARPLALDVLPENDAVALFHAVAGADRVRADDPDLPEIIALCGRLPLAISIVARRMAYQKALRTGTVARQLRHEHGRLARLADDDHDLTAALASSCQCLPAAEQTVFRHLGLIPGPDFDAYAAACLTGIDLGVAEQILESLLDRNLLVQRAADRFCFHDLVRVYVRSLNSPTSGSIDRLLEFYLFMSQSADRHIERHVPRGDVLVAAPAPGAHPDLDTPEQAEAWVSTELANLDAAVRYAAGHHRPGLVLALSSALAQYLRANGPWPLALALHQLALDTASQVGDRRGQAGALVELGVLHRRAGALDSAQDSLSQALRLYDQPGDRYGRAGALVELAVVQRLHAQYPQARESLAAALDIYRELSNRLGQASALAELGIVHRQGGDFAEAGETLARALGLYRELGNRYGEAVVLCYLGSLYQAMAAGQEAKRALRDALDLYRELGDRIGQANTLLVLGAHQAGEGDPQARQTLTESLDRYAELGDQRGQAGALAYLGVAHRLAGQPDQASGSFTRALELFRLAGDLGGEAEAHNLYGGLLAEAGLLEQAREQFEAAHSLAVQISSAMDRAVALEGLAATCRSQDAGQAADYYRQSLAIFHSLDGKANATRVQAALDSLGVGNAPIADAGRQQLCDKPARRLRQRDD